MPLEDRTLAIRLAQVGTNGIYPFDMGQRFLSAKFRNKCTRRLDVLVKLAADF